MENEIYFAGGCFWGLQEYFSRIQGVFETQAGYANSRIANPSYNEVCSGQTNAAETVKILYDTKKISLENLVKKFFAIIDPLSVNRQGNDIGTQYRTGIYYSNAEQKKAIEQVYAMEQGQYGKLLAVEVLPLQNFYPAEDYHQNYLKKNPGGYCHINLNKNLDEKNNSYDSSRHIRPDISDLKNRLANEEFAVTQKAATEPAFSGKYWNNYEPGIYVDIATGEPLFSSKDKFDSGTGWPSFTKSIDREAILGFIDTSCGMQRIEAKSRIGNSHLGHIFPDGPKTGLRYCINSASLRFVPLSEMDSEGYGSLKHLVTD